MAPAVLEPVIRQFLALVQTRACFSWGANFFVLSVLLESGSWCWSDAGHLEVPLWVAFPQVFPTAAAALSPARSS